MSNQLTVYPEYFTVGIDDINLKKKCFSLCLHSCILLLVCSVLRKIYILNDVDEYEKVKGDGMLLLKMCYEKLK